jgi:hypothetical protein
MLSVNQKNGSVKGLVCPKFQFEKSVPFILGNISVPLPMSARNSFSTV